MSIAEFRLICQRIAPYTEHIYLHVMGEPLLHPMLDELLTIAEDFDLSVSITTNGTLLQSMGSVLLAHRKALHKVSISVHCIEANPHIPMKPYLREAVLFAKEAAEHGIYSVFRLWNLDSADGTAKNKMNHDIEALLQKEFPAEWQRRYSGFRIAKNIFLEYAGIFTWPVESTAEPTELGRCHGLIDQLAVLADGTVVPCCLDSEGTIALGNLLREDLMTILSSERALLMREGLMHGKFTEPLCQKCTYAKRFSHKK